MLAYKLTLIDSTLEESDRTSSGISLKLYNVMMTHAMNMNVTSVNTALTCPPSMTPIQGNRILVYRFFGVYITIWKAFFLENDIGFQAK